MDNGYAGYDQGGGWDQGRGVQVSGGGGGQVPYHDQHQQHHGGTVTDRAALPLLWIEPLQMVLHDSAKIVRFGTYGTSRRVERVAHVHLSNKTLKRRHL